MSGKNNKTIGFKPSYIIEAEKKEKKEKKEEDRTEEEKSIDISKAIEKLTGGGLMKINLSPNEIMVMQKVEAYLALIKLEDFNIKSPEEKDAILNDLLLFQSISTELSTLRSLIK